MSCNIFKRSKSSLDASTPADAATPTTNADQTQIAELARSNAALQKRIEELEVQVADFQCDALWHDVERRRMELMQQDLQKAHDKYAAAAAAGIAAPWQRVVDNLEYYTLVAEAQKYRLFRDVTRDSAQGLGQQGFSGARNDAARNVDDAIPTTTDPTTFTSAFISGEISILNDIFLHLPQKDVILSRSVCRGFRDAVDAASPALRKHQFYLAITPSEALQQGLTALSRKYNPILREKFWFFWECRGRGRVDHLAIAYDKLHSGLEKFDLGDGIAADVSSAGWQRVLISQPPFTTLKIWMISSLYVNHLYESREPLLEGTYDDPDGIRMGILWDIIEQHARGCERGNIQHGILASWGCAIGANQGRELILILRRSWGKKHSASNVRPIINGSDGSEIMMRPVGRVRGNIPSPYPGNPPINANYWRAVYKDCTTRNLLSRQGA